MTTELENKSLYQAVTSLERKERKLNLDKNAILDLSENKLNAEQMNDVKGGIEIQATIEVEQTNFVCCPWDPL